MRLSCSLQDKSADMPTFQHEIEGYMQRRDMGRKNGMFHKKICEPHLSIDYAQVTATAVTEKVTYYAYQRTRINSLSSSHVLR